MLTYTQLKRRVRQISLCWCNKALAINILMLAATLFNIFASIIKLVAVKFDVPKNYCARTTEYN